MNRLIHFATAVLLTASAALMPTLSIYAQAPPAEVRLVEGNLEGDSPDREVSVFLPPSYASSPDRRYAVLYLLHGFGDVDSDWFQSNRKFYINLPAAVQRAYANGVSELIIVMPNAMTKYRGSMFSSSPVTGDWEAFIARDLVNYTDTHYRTLARPQSRGLAGHSMGGYGTIRIGMKYPHVFSALYALSPCCMQPDLNPQTSVLAKAFDIAAEVKSESELARLDFLPLVVLASAAAWSPDPQRPPILVDLPVVSGKIVPDVVATWAANALIAMVPQYVSSLKVYDGIAIDAGDLDTQTSIVQSVRAIDRLLTKYGIAHIAEIYGGDHDNRIEERMAMKVLPFFSQHLKF